MHAKHTFTGQIPPKTLYLLFCNYVYTQNRHFFFFLSLGGPRRPSYVACPRCGHSFDSHAIFFRQKYVPPMILTNALCLSFLPLPPFPLPPFSFFSLPIFLSTSLIYLIFCAHCRLKKLLNGGLVPYKLFFSPLLFFPLFLHL